MTFNASDLHDNVVSVPRQLGIFDVVVGHEPKSAPVNYRTCAVWLGPIRPYPPGSGLAATTGLVVFNSRVYIPMMADPLDQVEKDMLDAISALMTAYSGDFQLDASVRNVDLLGASGVALSAETGYVNIDGVLFRIGTITVPLIINDCWIQTA